MTQTMLVPGAMWPAKQQMVARLPLEPDLQQLQVDAFLIGREGPLEVYWCPFERLNAAARVAIVGLTPGAYQMREAFVAARVALEQGLGTIDALDYIDRAASFAGAMRNNMVKMLDQIGLADALQLSTTGELFDARDDLVHTTSALRYPVLRNGHNYAGTGPHVSKSALLRNIVIELLAPELAAVPSALVIPLGKATEACLSELVRAESLSAERCLFGFPHPSGGNGHRVRQFNQTRTALEREVAIWADTYS